MSNPSNRASMRGQLTLRGVVIGVLGCVIITASSAYTALKMGAPLADRLRCRHLAVLP